MPEKLLIAYIAAGAAITGALVAVLGTALGAFLTWRANRSLEAIRLINTELINRSVESIRLANLDLSSLRELKREAYVEYLAACTHINALHGTNPNPLGIEVLNWMNAQAKIELLAPPDVYTAILAHSHVISDQIFNPKPSMPADAWGKTRESALAAIRSDVLTTIQPAAPIQ